MINEVVGTNWKKLQPLYLPQPTTEMWKSFALNFENNWRFPRCTESFDGKYIIVLKILKKPRYSFQNNKQLFSVVIMASVSTAYKLTTIDIGSMSNFSKENFFATSPKRTKLTNKKLYLTESSTSWLIDKHLP